MFGSGLFFPSYGPMVCHDVHTNKAMPERSSISQFPTNPNLALATEMNMGHIVTLWPDEKTDPQIAQQAAINELTSLVLDERAPMSNLVLFLMPETSDGQQSLEKYRIWLFNIAMENAQFMYDFYHFFTYIIQGVPLETSGFCPRTMLNDHAKTVDDPMTQLYPETDSMTTKRVAARAAKRSSSRF